MASRRSAIVAAVVAFATVAVTAGSALAGDDDRPPNAGPPSSVGRPSNPGNSRNSRPPSPPGQASASGGAPQVDAPASTALRNAVAATAPQVDAPASTAPLNAVAAAAPAVDECAGPSAAGASPSDRFWTAVCARRNATGPVEDQLGMPAPTRQSAEQDRVAMCSPGFEFPNREQVADSWRLTIRQVTRDNPALGERLLDDGVLTAFEHQRLQDGTLLFDIAYNMDAVNVLVDADLQLFAWFIENRAAVCAGNP